MNNKKIKTQLFTSLLLTFAGAHFANAEPTAGAYVDDEQRFYIEGQPLTEAMQLAEEIVCSLAAMRPGAFVDKGAYVAKYYDGRCDGNGADLESESAAATPTSAESNSTVSSATSVAADTAELAELATLEVVEVVSGEQAGDITGKTWITLLAEEQGELDSKLYINTELTEGVTAASPNGDFEMWFSSHVFGDNLPSFLSDLGGRGLVDQGYLKVSGTDITFKEAYINGEENLSLSISASGDTEGIFSRKIRGCENCSDQSNVKYFDLQANYQFYIDAGQKQFCRNLQSVSVLCYGFGNDIDLCVGAEDTRVTDVNDENYNGFEPLRVPVSLVEELPVPDSNVELALDINGELIIEECFSTNKSDATKNIHRYGVYDANGDRITMVKEGEVSSFSMFADVGVDASDETILERVYGYASYDGVYFDTRGRELIVPGVTEFKKEEFGSAVASSSDVYVVSETEVVVEKRTTEYVSLASIDKIKLSLWVGDSYWAAELTALLGVDPAGLEHLIGSYDTATGDFTMHTSVTNNPYSEDLLSTPIVFSRLDWLASMKRDYGDYTYLRSMGVWSNDTRQWYEISAAALNDPTISLPQPANNSGPCPDDIGSTIQTDSCRGGIKTEITEFVSLSALSDKKLACIENCLEPSLMEATYLIGYCGTEAGQSDSATCAGVADTSPLPTPFSNVGPFIKENVMDGPDAGDWRDGIRASNVVKYEVSDDKSGFEVGGVSLTKGGEVTSFLNALSDPYDAFGDAQYLRLDGRSERLSWGLGTGALILDSDLAKIECQKDNLGAYEDHPEFIGDEETELRYCVNKIYEGVGLTTYRIRINNRSSYSLMLSGTDTAVVVAAPGTLYYQVPDEDAYGQDSGKRLSLGFGGHGQLRGVPGYIYDVNTGEDLGEFTNEWKDSYRYINRFVIPDGSVVTDYDGVEYFVKALDGEEWFKKLEAASSVQPVYTFTAARLAPNSILRVMGDPNSDDYIGEAPTCVDPDNTETCALLNNGSPAVEHGVLASGFEDNN
jgi:hypothetical protein